MTEEAFIRGSGKPLREWLEILDAWGASEHGHSDIARWVVKEHGIGGWWAQSVTVAWERARGIRVLHQDPAGFSISVSKTVAAAAMRVSDAWTDASLRSAWLPDAPIRLRRSTRGRSARFDWDEPPSLVGVMLFAKGDAKTQISLGHQKLPDADAADRTQAHVARTPLRAEGASRGPVTRGSVDTSAKSHRNLVSRCVSSVDRRLIGVSGSPTRSSCGGASLQRRNRTRPAVHVTNRRRSGVCAGAGRSRLHSRPRCASRSAPTTRASISRVTSARCSTSCASSTATSGRSARSRSTIPTSSPRSHAPWRGASSSAGSCSAGAGPAKRSSRTRCAASAAWRRTIR